MVFDYRYFGGGEKKGVTGENPALSPLFDTCVIYQKNQKKKREKREIRLAVVVDAVVEFQVFSFPA
jgi:hypothetical protein